MMKIDPVTLHGQLVRPESLRKRLGAVKEGVLPNHFLLFDGSYGHRVYYSIIQSEWPSVKAHLEILMRRWGNYQQLCWVSLQKGMNCPSVRLHVLCLV